MAKINRISGVLNQFGSPSLNSNTFANRPAPGQPGRLFVSTDTFIIYRDTGTTWTAIGGAGSTPNLQQVTTVGNNSTVGIFLGISGSLTPGLQFEVSGYSRFSQTVVSGSNLGSNVNQYFELQTNGITINTGTPSPSYSQFVLRNNAAQTIGGAGNCQIGAGLFENVITDSGTGSYPLTITQTVGISALSPIISYSRYTGTFGSSINYYAGIVINGIQATAGSAINITNNYQLLINSSKQFIGSTTIANRWGIYQNGSDDWNYFAATVAIGTTFGDFGTYKLYINGNSYVSGYMLTNTMFATTTATNELKPQFPNPTLQMNTTGGLKGITMYDNTGDIFIGTTPFATTRKLTVRGNLELLTTTDSGTHTPNAQHIPIWVNGNQYFIQLLNPSI